MYEQDSAFGLIEPLFIQYISMIEILLTNLNIFILQQFYKK